jgi:hypothetical protein
MKYRYTKFTGDALDELDLEDLVSKLSDLLLSSGFELTDATRSARCGAPRRDSRRAFTGASCGGDDSAVARRSADGDQTKRGCTRGAGQQIIDADGEGYITAPPT